MDSLCLTKAGIFAMIQAENVVRKLLAMEGREDDPILLCALGDITRNEEHYHKAIQVFL